MSKKIMGANEYEAFVEEYIDYTEDCEFPVKESSKRSRKQRKMAAKKNKFPVGLRKEINSSRRRKKEIETISYRRVFESSENKIKAVILQDVAEEKENMEKFGNTFEDPNHDDPYEENIFYEFLNWRYEQRQIAAVQQAFRKEFGNTFEDPNHNDPYEDNIFNEFWNWRDDNLFHEFWNWRDEQLKMENEQQAQALREEFGY